MAELIIPEECVCRGVLRNNILFDLLITNRNKNVLFLGEGDFSFTVAFAALRVYHGQVQAYYTWSGITSTRYEPDGPEGEFQLFGKTLVPCKPGLNLKEVKLECVASVADYAFSKLQQVLAEPYQIGMLSTLFQTLSIKIDKYVNKIQSIKSLPILPGNSCLYGIDALAIPRELLQANQVIWFQCPWIKRCDGDTYPFIYNLLLNAATHIGSNVHVCIGITKHDAYFDYYGLDRLTSDRNISGMYDFLGGDDVLVKKVLSFGYHHQTVTSYDIHQKILEDHVTLIFRRKLLPFPIATAGTVHALRSPTS